MAQRSSLSAQTVTANTRSVLIVQEQMMAAKTITVPVLVAALNVTQM